MKSFFITAIMFVFSTGVFAQNAQQAPASRGQVDYSKPVTTNGKIQNTNPNRVRPATGSYNTPVTVPANKTTQPVSTKRPLTNSDANTTGQKK
jgi:hypothetical protein